MSVIDTAVESFKTTAYLAYRMQKPPFRPATTIPACSGACSGVSV